MIKTLNKQGHKIVAIDIYTNGESIAHDFLTARQWGPWLKSLLHCIYCYGKNGKLSYLNPLAPLFKHMDIMKLNTDNKLKVDDGIFDHILSLEIHHSVISDVFWHKKIQ